MWSVDTRHRWRHEFSRNASESSEHHCLGDKPALPVGIGDAWPLPLVEVLSALRIPTEITFVALEGRHRGSTIGGRATRLETLLSEWLGDSLLSLAVVASVSRAATIGATRGGTGLVTLT